MKNNSVSWIEVDNMISAISNQVKDSKFTPDFIAPIPKGGWAVASLLAQQLNIKNSISLSQDKIENSIKTYIAGFPNIKNKNILVVEDSIETGNSILNAKLELLKLGANVKTSALFISPNCEDTNKFTDFYFKIGEIPEFPWEIQY